MELTNESVPSLTLSQFTAQIKNAVNNAKLLAWVVAEISEISFRGGHYYLDLIEKSESSRNPVAKIRANIWSSIAYRIIPKFTNETQRELQIGMKVMFLAQASFHELYGISLTILDIDSNYTLGDIERQRLETLRRLQEDGIIDMNKQLALPLSLQRLAIISSKTAAGYGDFCNQLDSNKYKFNIEYDLFEALVQGADAERTIIAALDTIASYTDKYDAVIIIRGGGSKADLACFDGYELASNIAQFPLPVITGIGHERDNSVADVVANTRMKTPTAVAEFIINHNLLLLNKLNELQADISNITYYYITNEKIQNNQLFTQLNSFAINYITSQKRIISHLDERFSLSAKMRLSNETNTLKNIQLQLHNSSTLYIKESAHRLQQYELNIDAINPKRILNLGYTITESKSKRIRSANDVVSGEEIVTITANGKIRSKVN
ncbi:MAG: exodeoxyribonuclease VII large subunit [Marinilabiliaceae bacterium]|nr:exodeoxyribonuclease VII large subunit [Marinilabiliaceae bacterium]